MKFRKKPVIIDAVQFNPPDKFEFGKTKFENFNVLHNANLNVFYLLIDTLEGTMTCNEGDYIITGVNGEKYPCKPDIFEKTYDKVN